ncbi:MAG: gliding motility-associated C-terminal domain-containing protein [Bacteroidota bacterium]
MNHISQIRLYFLFLLFLFGLHSTHAQEVTTDTLVLQTACDQEAVWCSDVLIDEALRFRIRLDGRILEETQGCNFSMTGYYAPINNAILSPDFAPFYVDNWRVDEQLFSGEFLTIDALVDSLNTWDENGNWRFSVMSERLVGGDSNQNYGELRIEILPTSTTINAPYIQKSIAQNVGIALPIGIHELQITDLFTLEQQEQTIRVVCTDTDSISLNLSIGESRIICLDDSELTPPLSDLINTQEADSYSWRRIVDNCIEVRGNLNEAINTYFVQCDTLGICDSTFVQIAVRTALNRQQRDVVRVGDSDHFCLEQQRLLPGDLIRFENECADDAIADFELDETDFCLNYKGQQAGQTSACLRYEDSFGNRDSLDFLLTVVEPEYISDTLFLNLDEGVFCFDLNDFGGLVTITEDCERPTVSDIVDFDLDVKEYCLSYTGTAVGMDSICVWIVDTEGNASLTVFQITVTQPMSSVASASLFINETLEVCIDTSELPGTVNNFFNVCPLLSGDKVEVDVLSSNCIRLTGRETGSERACLVACDDLGFCDTTFLIVNVVPFSDPPNAEDDEASTNQDENITITIQENDDLTGGISVISIGDAPENGTVILNPDGTITYFPDKQNCTGQDQFTYFICNDNGCDNATVRITVQCEGIEIFDGFSPNGDGINDVFFIANIDAQGDNLLQIYNRWGHLVYEQRNYQNDWTGKWKGKDLPDGTYFYILEVEQLDGSKEVFKGNLELHR